MKHTHRIIRLLTLAVVSCALAALLSGCTKEEFIAGYNEFLFGDWFPSPPSAGETTAAEGSASGDSGHVYAEPNPECDAKISSLMSELYSLESSARKLCPHAAQRRSRTRTALRTVRKDGRGHRRHEGLRRRRPAQH